MAAVRRGLPLVLVLLAAYAATLGLDAAPGARFTAAEARHLLTAESLVSDGDLDLRDEYATRAWADWYEGDLEPSAALTDGRLHEPHGVAFSLLIAPAHAVAGPTGVELFLALLLAGAIALAVPLGRRLVPDPWPGRAALVVGLSPPALAAATTVAPATAAALPLAAAALLALHVREHPRLATVFWCALLAALLPWVALGLLAPAVVVAAALARWLRRRGRGLVGFTALEVVVVSAVTYVAVNDRLFGGPVPDAARVDGAAAATGLDDAADVVERLPRLAGVLVDRDAGLLRWAPVLVLALWAVWVLVRSRRERLALVVPERRDVEVGATFLALIAAAGLPVAALAPRTLGGAWLVPPDVPALLPVLAALVAFGSRHAGRAAPVLAALTLAASAWMLIGARADDRAGLAPPRGALPWGGAQDVLPRVRSGDAPRAIR